MLSKTCRVWTAISRATTWPVTGSTGTVPEMEQEVAGTYSLRVRSDWFHCLVGEGTTCLDLAIRAPSLLPSASPRCRCCSPGATDRSGIVGDVDRSGGRVRTRWGPAQQLGRSIRATVRRLRAVACGTLACEERGVEG